MRGGKLVAEWRLDDFAQVAALTRAAIRLSARMNHHPSVEFGYRVFRATYVTHSAGGLTDLDFYCARRLSAAVARL